MTSSEERETRDSSLGDADAESVKAECGYWFSSFCVLGSVLVFLNTGMIFTRYIYVGYAADLTTGGERLLNIVIGVAVTIFRCSSSLISSFILEMFSLQFWIFYPILGYTVEKDYPLNVLKGKICTRTYIDGVYYHLESHVI